MRSQKDVELSDLFASIDTDGGGTLDNAEIGSLMQRLGLALKVQSSRPCSRSHPCGEPLLQL